MMKHIINNSLIVLVLLIVNSLTAQQDPTFTLYQYNMNVVNPAYAGINDYAEVNLNYRSQWVNLDGSPETQSMSLGVPVGKNVGIGLSVVNDKVFVLKETDIYADFSYRVKVSDSTDLYLGLKAGGSAINIDLNDLGITDDPVFSENVSRFNPNIGIGAYLKGKKYYITLSAPTLLKSKRYEKDGVVVTHATNRMHVYTGAGFTFNLNQNIDITPSFMSRIVSGAPISLDLTTIANFNDVLEFGLSYRIDESLSVIGLFNFTSWGQLGYAYEMTTTEVKDYSKGSHEILLRFKIY